MLLWQISIVISDIANSCRELLSSTTLPDDLPATLKQLLQVCLMMIGNVQFDMTFNILDFDTCICSFSKWVWLH